MKHVLYTALLAVGMTLPCHLQAKVGDLLPKPQQIQTNRQTFFSLNRAVALTDPTNCTYLANVLTQNGCKFEANAEAKVKVTLVDRIDGAFNHNVNLFPDEAYRLHITANEVSIEAVTPTGVIRAAQTLQQLAEGYEAGNEAFEALELTDWPAFKVRGFMHDVGRSYIEFEELKKQIDLLARFKVNVFHWHLTDYTGWRFEVKAYPNLTAAQYNIRQPGKFYTQEQCSELVAYAKERGVTVIPEIDMPGHSHVFEKAMGYGMQTDQGVEALKKILDEAAKVFEGVPYLHIGGDEVRITYPDFLKIMTDHVRNKNLKVMLWNRLVAGPPSADLCDMTQMWATSGNVVKGVPNIDCRYNYTNHFDVYADLVGIYKSNIYYEQQGTDEVAGTISAAWNDTKTRTDADIVKQNNMYANVLASAERAWLGGGKQYIEKGGTSLPNSGEEFEEFADFERRFLFHKNHSLKNEPIAYVRQTNVRWRITDPFPNNGNKALALPPETSEADILPSSFTYKGENYHSHTATGAGIYLRHIWHPTVPSYFSNPQNNQTAYAWTYVYSPEAQDVGAQIEFYTYSRSGDEKGPIAGCWDRRGSKIWINNEEIPAPVWEQPEANIPQNHATSGLTNENLTARPVTKIHLNKGWNKVFMRLPHVNSGGTRRDKWQFTFVITDTEGRNAVDGLIYSPNKCIDANADAVSVLIEEIEGYTRSHFSDEPGFLPISLAATLLEKVEEIKATLQNEMSQTEREAQMADLNDVWNKLKDAEKTAEPNMPTASSDEKVIPYTLSTPLRENRYPTSKGENADLIGEKTFAGKAASWKFVPLNDTEFHIVNIADGLYISPDAAFNKAVKTVKQAPQKGWTLKRADELGYFIITSGNVQLNQTNTDVHKFALFNWGNGTNTTDAGCKFRIVATSIPEENDVKLSDDNVTYWYRFAAKRENRYPTSKGAGMALVGETTPDKHAEWKLQKRTDGGFDIINRADNSFISPIAENAQPLKTSETASQKGWNLLATSISGCYAIINGTSQLNMQNHSPYNVLNWGGGTNVTDEGCQYTFELVETVTGISNIPMSDQPQATTYYDLSGRKVMHPSRGIYINNNGQKVFIH